MRCSYKLLPAVPTVCKRACLATLSKKTLLEEIQAKELVAHWEQDCPCHPPQGAPFCEVLENLAHRIYQPLQWNESLFPVALLTQPTDTLRHHLAFGTRRQSCLYTLPCLRRSGRTDFSASSHVQHEFLLYALLLQHWKWHNGKKTANVAKPNLLVKSC